MKLSSNPDYNNANWIRVNIVPLSAFKTLLSANSKWATPCFPASTGSQRPGALHRYPASLARDRGRFLANGLGTKVPPDCHGEWGRERETGTFFQLLSLFLCTIVGIMIMKEIIGIFLNISLLLSMVGSLLSTSLLCYPFQSSVFLNAPSRKLSWHLSYSIIIF